MRAALEDNQYKFWDIVIKAVSSFLAIGTVIITASTYMSSRRAELRQQEREFRKEISVRQINYYSEISQSIGGLLNILSYRDSLFTKTYFAKKDNFEELYFGKMNLIESRNVDMQLQVFRSLLEKYEADNSGVTIFDLRLAAFKVNDEFRKSLRKTFDVKLDSLTK